LNEILNGEKNRDDEPAVDDAGSSLQ